MKVHIEFELPKWSKKIIAVGAPVVVLGALATIAIAAPTQFGTGEQLTHEKLNQLSVVTYDGGTYSVGGTLFCGYGATTQGAFQVGNATGYQGAKKLCEGAMGCSRTAHMCTAEEIVRSTQLGVPALNAGQTFPGADPMAWYATGSFAGTGGTNIVDCYGWSQNGGIKGAVWVLTPASYGPSGDVCSNPHPILCCD